MRVSKAADTLCVHARFNGHLQAYHMFVVCVCVCVRVGLDAAEAPHVL